MKVSQSWDHARTEWYADLDNKTLSKTKDATHNKRVRIYAWGIGLMMYGDSDEKGMMGLEVPESDLKDKVKVSIRHSNGTVADDAEIHLWDYSENDSMSRGHLGTDYYFGMNTTYARGAWIPVNRTRGGADGDMENHCYKGGTYSLVDNSGSSLDSATFATTATGYALSPTYQFPRLVAEHSGSAYKNSRDISKRQMFISCLNLSVAVVLPEDVQYQDNPDSGHSSETFTLTCDASEIDIKGASGECTQTPASARGDDAASTSVPVYSPGTLEKYINDTGYSWSDGLMFKSIGQTVGLYNNVSTSGSDVYRAFDYLVKLDTSAYDTKNINVVQGAQRRYSPLGNVTYWYAAKPDGTGWSNDDEMMATRAEQLVYYKDLSSLNASGRTCVGVLQQIRGCTVSGERDYTYFTVNAPVSKSATPGYVAMACSDLRGWIRTDNPGTVCRDNGDGTYGYGDATKTSIGQYEDGYTTPDRILEQRKYVKTQYRDGVMVGGNTGGAACGSSCLIVGAYASVGITADKDTYDLDKGERTATFTVSPNIREASSGYGATGRSTQATVKVVVPKGLHYVNGSTNIPVSSVETDANGSTVLTFKLNDVKVGGAILPITFKTTIGHAGYDDDAQNAEQFSVQASIICPEDPRAISTLSGNVSNTSIRCVKLASLAIYKAVDHEHGNLGAPHTWTLTIGNMSNTDVDNARAVDVLPSNNDSLGSAFHGRYHIDSITVDFSSAQKSTAYIDDSSSIVLYSPNIVSNQQSLLESVKTSADISSSSVPLNKASLTSRSTSNELTYDMSSASSISTIMLLVPRIVAHETVSVIIHVSTSGDDASMYEDVSGESQQPGDKYSNQFMQYADNQIAIVRSNVVTTDVDMVSFNMVKKWVGDEKYAAYRPSSINLNVSGSDGSSRTYSVSSPQYEAGSGLLPKYDASGNIITYACSEQNVPQWYRCDVDGDDKSGFTITNTSTYKSAGTFNIVGTKRLHGRDFENGDAMTFKVTGFCSDSSLQAPMPSNVDSNGLITIHPDSGNEYTIDFGNINVDERYDGCELSYVITETDADAHGVGIDLSSKRISAKIDDSAHTGSIKITTSQPDGDVVFNDTYYSFLPLTGSREMLAVIGLGVIVLSLALARAYSVCSRKHTEYNSRRD